MFVDKLRFLIPGRDNKIKMIIHGAASEAAIVGLATAQVPGDRFIIGAVQIDMVIGIAAQYGVSITKSAALALISSSIATIIGMEVANGVVKYFPGIGNISNATTAFTVTETIGWAADKYYRNN